MNETNFPETGVEKWQTHSKSLFPQNAVNKRNADRAPVFQKKRSGKKGDAL